VGKSVQSVLQSEFHELGNPERLQLMFQKSLIRVNGIPVNGEAALFKGVDTNRAISQDVLLKNMDVISRITHWHEPPVKVPELIEVQKIQIPIAVLDDNFGSSDNVLVSDEAFFFCCNKPATVPVHPAGPYLQNSLTLMVEAQEGLEPRSLLPCHRLDRCTSGLTLCCTSPAVARLLQVQMDRKLVDKMYLARVKVRQGHIILLSYGKEANTNVSWQNFVG
jgi:23S rRNA-/tRNA-specific pseudouridylate synthase